MTQPLPDAKPPRGSTSLLLYLAISLTAFFPCLFLGKAYFANDLLHQYAHFRTLLRDQLLGGHFPLWNPYFLGGQPFFADPNVMMAYPMNYLTLFFPLTFGFGIFFALHLFLAACGTHLWLKSLRLSPTACRVGALTFALSGFFWWEVIHPPILAAYAWFPWVLACLERFLTSWRPSWAFAAGGAFGMVFTAGNFQSTTCVLYTALGYTLFRLGIRPSDGGTNGPLPWKKVALGLLFALWGGAFLSAHLFPADEFSKLTNRRDPEQTYDNFQGTFSMRPSSTYEFLLPGMGVGKNTTLEDAIQMVTDMKAMDNAFLGAFGYVGVWAPFLAFFAFARKDRNLQWFLLAGALAAVLIAWGRYFPLHRLLCLTLPGVDLSRAPFRTLQTYCLFLTALSAFGYQTLERRFQEGTGTLNLLLGAGVFAFLLLMGCVFNLVQCWPEALGLLVGVAGLALQAMTHQWRTLGKSLFLGALLLPLLAAGWVRGFTLGPSSNFDLEANFPAFTELKARAKEGRFHFHDQLIYPIWFRGQRVGWNFPQDAPLSLGIRASGGYNPIYLKQTSALRALPMTNFFRVMGIQGFLMPQDPGPNKEYRTKPLGGSFLLEPLDPVGMVTAPVSVIAIKEPNFRLGVLSALSFDPRQLGVLSDPLPGSLAGPRPPGKPILKSELTRDEANHQTYRIGLDRENLVVFSEVVFPGWEARLDGAPAPLLTSNHVFRSLVVPAGEHTVEFLYRPSWAGPLLAFLVLWAFSACGYGLFLLRKKARSAGTGMNADGRG